MRTDLRHGNAFSKTADLRQHHPLAGQHGGLQAVGVLGFDADHLHLGAQVFDVGGDPGDQAAAPHGNEDRIQCARLLTQDLHGHRALACDHVRIVEGRDKGRAFAVGEFQRMGQGMRKTVAMQDHFTTA
ncbi:hypothetical protein D9M71_505490 [compost metagenome]